MESYQDSPKSLEELQRAVFDPKPGYDNHHIAEKASASGDGFPEWMINSPENIVRIPRMKHWEINRWYETRLKDFDYQTPREYLKGKSWEEKLRVGLRALRENGVLE